MYDIKRIFKQIKIKNRILKLLERSRIKEFVLILHKKFESKNSVSEFFEGIDQVLNNKPEIITLIFPVTMMVFVVTIFLWISLSNIDIIITSTGKIIPTKRIQLVQSKDREIVVDIFVNDGDTVKSGDKLISFENSQALGELNGLKIESYSLMSQRMGLEKFIMFLNKQEIPKDWNSSIPVPSIYTNKENLLLLSKIKAYKTKKRFLKFKVQEVRSSIRKNREEFKKVSSLLPYKEKTLSNLKPLVQKGLESQAVLDQKKEDYLTQKGDSLVKKAFISELEVQKKSSIEELNLYTIDLLQESYLKSVELNTKINQVLESLRNAQITLDSKILRSKIDGTIFNKQVHTIGGFVEAGNPIMQIVPKDSKLEVEAKVLNKDIAFVNVGHDVNIKIDSFPFTKYGHIPAVIKKIEHSSIQDEILGDVYIVTMSLERDFMKADSTRINLIPGMTCTADIKTGSRKIIDYIISPILRYKDEALKER
jgi:HlyD family type I secretion membrane fusion protein